MKSIANYIRREYGHTLLYAGVQSCRKTLIQNDALAVFNNDSHAFVGVLTPKDVIERPHLLVADCLTQKPFMQESNTPDEVFETMLLHHTNVLPVVSDDNKLQGLIFKQDLIKALRKKNDMLITAQNELLKNIVFTQSHIVRRPLSNILALLDLVDTEALSEENKHLLSLLHISASELDASIRDTVQMVSHAFTPEVPQQ